MGFAVYGSSFVAQVMSGGLLAMSRSWWEETGGYDSSMRGWGGENLDQSLRIWRCGGELSPFISLRTAPAQISPGKLIPRQRLPLLTSPHISRDAIFTRRDRRGSYECRRAHVARWLGAHTGKLPSGP